jgi:hypothetical protein
MRGRVFTLTSSLVVASTLFAHSALPDHPRDRYPPNDPPIRLLRVCTDPNNLPFSNRAEQGFENRIARLLAAEVGAEVRYTWWRGSVLARRVEAALIRCREDVRSILEQYGVPLLPDGPGKAT